MVCHVACFIVFIVFIVEGKVSVGMRAVRASVGRRWHRMRSPAVKPRAHGTERALVNHRHAAVAHQPRLQMTLARFARVAQRITRAPRDAEDDGPAGLALDRVREQTVQRRQQLGIDRSAHVQVETRVCSVGLARGAVALDDVAKLAAYQQGFADAAQFADGRFHLQQQKQPPTPRGH